MRVSPARLFVALLLLSSSAFAQGLAIPRRHDRAPGPALTPEQAVKKMTVPEGFTVEIVASEPQIMNPVAMCIDEKGRFWVTESFEYPRREPGPGKDRIKVLEDTDQDGKVDKVTVFAEGLNIPSGINVGHGGVWVANAPDLLFMQDTDGDLKADKTEVLLTGWGRDDTHELPNSLTWGPDGWLYGLNGVFNFGHVKYGKDNPNLAKNPDHPGWPITCAVWRINPHTKEFDIFAEGTSNPWGIAINDEGELFLSACVIDHFWHITQTGYYIRQGGPYPPHTWPIGSIVQHQHQKAAYCGITWFDSDAYPEEYRKVFYMGNIHGGCINADITEPHGSTYKGKPHPGFTPKPGAFEGDEFHTARKTGDEKNPKLADLLTANDPWFMPVVQKTGPDGCLYILDWYDRYHCYQDANADPAGIEREKGRLYRLRYKETPRAPKFDLAKETDEQLIERLGSPNVYFRETAQRVLQERGDDTAIALGQFINSRNKPSLKRRHAVFALIGQPSIKAMQVATKVIDDGDQATSIWLSRFIFSSELVQRIANAVANPEEITQRMLVKASSDMTRDKTVQLPRAKMSGIITIASKGYRSAEFPSWFDLIVATDGDSIIPQMAWQNLHNDLEDHTDDFLMVLEKGKYLRHAAIAKLMPRFAARILARKQFKAAEIAKLLSLLSAQDNEDCRNAARQLLWSIAESSQTGGLDAAKREALKTEFASTFEAVSKAGESHPLYVPATQVQCSWGDATAIAAVAKMLAETKDEPHKIGCLKALIGGAAPSALSIAENLLDTTSVGTQEQVLFLLGRMNSPKIADAILARYAKFEPGLQPRALELLTTRAEWSAPLLSAIEAKTISKDAPNLNQLRRMASFKDEAFAKQFKALYGTIREGRNPDREQVLNKTRDFLHGTPGDPERGIVVFKKVCAQCHKLYGEGAEVGPDLTGSGRNNWDQLLTNVLDPSLVIGGSYQARVLQTTDGRVLTGLAVEDNDQRVVLKVQGGKLETVPRDQIEVYKVSEVSMMPEQLEKQITPQELADLFSYLALDKPPTDPSAKYLPGYPRQK
jgi:putative heme-binding domain-containing protein